MRAERVNWTYFAVERCGMSNFSFQFSMKSVKMKNFGYFYLICFHYVQNRTENLK